MAQHEDALQRLYAHYRKADARGRRPRPDLEAVDDLLATRVALYEQLLREGWDAPVPVRRQLRLDAELLELPPSWAAG